MKSMKRQKNERLHLHSLIFYIILDQIRYLNNDIYKYRLPDDSPPPDKPVYAHQLSSYSIFLPNHTLMALASQVTQMDSSLYL